MTTQQRDALHRLWDFFCSLSLTMFLLISLAFISIIGTIIPQGTPPPEYLATITPAKVTLYQSLGFFDMYHSWWFVLLLYFLVVNLYGHAADMEPIMEIAARHNLFVIEDNAQGIGNVYTC